MGFVLIVQDNIDVADPSLIETLASDANCG